MEKFGSFLLFAQVIFQGCSPSPIWVSQAGLGNFHSSFSVLSALQNTELPTFPPTFSLHSSCLPTEYCFTYIFPPHFHCSPHVCPPVLQGQISVLRALCFSTAWIKPWEQGLWSVKCCVLATGSEEEVGKESGRLGAAWATLLKGGKCVGWPDSFWALIPDVFSRAVLVHWGISWFHNSSSLLHPFHWSGNWGMEQKTHFSEYFVISAAHCDQ